MAKVCPLDNNKKCPFTTLKCVLVRSGFHYILNELGNFYHGETSQPLNEQGPIVMDNELVH
jgi:hypothetical protein